MLKPQQRVWIRNDHTLLVQRSKPLNLLCDWMESGNKISNKSRKKIGDKNHLKQIPWRRYGSKKNSGWCTLWGGTALKDLAATS